MFLILQQPMNMRLVLNTNTLHTLEPASRSALFAGLEILGQAICLTQFRSSLLVEALRV